ncbi:ATP-binding cassette domain-containing protein [Amycolatopsis sp. NPDC051373]|uniref:ATP-binding cassette domain-containing protein n=1 Tax=Amycolatopsis sp. NPDC051373 TaxID=3155801 RepID=UPI00344D98EC
MTTTLEQPTLAVRNLDISYRRGSRVSPVVRDVSFTIRPGEAYGLVGESGCGKTTVAMSIMRYLPDNAVVSDGSGITFAGEDALSAGKGLLRQWRGGRIAMVYQNPGASLNPSFASERRSPKASGCTVDCPLQNARRRPSRCWPRSGSRTRPRAPAATRTSSPAASSNA